MLIQYFDAFLVLCFIKRCNLCYHSKQWTFNRFHIKTMYRQVLSLENSRFSRFSGQPRKPAAPSAAEMEGRGSQSQFAVVG